MNRRELLATLIGAATLDPERLLWVPGRKTISIPKPAQRKLLSYMQYYFVTQKGKAYTNTIDGQWKEIPAVLLQSQPFLPWADFIWTATTSIGPAISTPAKHSSDY